MFSEARTRPRHCSAGRTQEGADTARRNRRRPLGPAQHRRRRRYGRAPAERQHGRLKTVDFRAGKLRREHEYRAVGVRKLALNPAGAQVLRKLRSAYPLAFGATVIFSGSSPQSANPLSRRADFSPERRRAAVQPVRISRREIRVCPVERLQDQVGRACGREQRHGPHCILRKHGGRGRRNMQIGGAGERRQRFLGRITAYPRRGRADAWTRAETADTRRVRCRPAKARRSGGRPPTGARYPEYCRYSPGL